MGFIVITDLVKGLRNAEGPFNCGMLETLLCAIIIWGGFGVKSNYFEPFQVI
jgi:hypothetical protein